MIRDNILDALEAILSGVTGINTVDRKSVFPITLLSYTQANLPLIFVLDPGEVYDYQPGHRSMNEMTLQARLIVLDWDEDPASYNALLGVMKEALHDDHTLGGLATSTNVTRIENPVQETYPLVHVNFELTISYYRSTKLA